MSLLEDITEEQIGKYDTMLKGFDPKEIAKMFSVSYNEDNDGGVKNLLNGAYTNYLQMSENLLEVEARDSDAAHKVIDTYVESLLKTFKPEVYEKVMRTIEGLDAEEKRHYMQSVTTSYLGLNPQAKQVFEKVYDKLYEDGDVGGALEILEGQFKHPEQGIAKQNLMKDFFQEIQNPEQAASLVKYVNDTYLQPRGLEISEAQAMIIGSDQQKAMEFVQSAVQGNYTQQFMDKYFVQGYNPGN
jgi:hypothetical protein